MKIIRFILLLFHLGILGLLLLTLLNSVISPEVFPYLNLLSLAFPVFMILNVLLCLLWIILWKKKAIFFLLFSLLFYNPVKRWINFSFPEKETANFKVITLNVESGIRGEDMIRKYMEEEKANIIFFQESRFHVNLTLHIDKFPNRAFCNIAEVQTNCKILKQEVIFDNTFQGTSFYTDIEFKGKIIRVINVYLSPFSFDKDKIKPAESLDKNEGKVKYVLRTLIPTFKVHQREIDAVRKAIDASPYPVIVAGDFNAVPNSYEYYTIGKNLTDAFVAVGRGSSTSFHDYKFPIRIDYIFTSKEIKPIRYRVDRSVKLSDHFPVIAEFKIN